MGETSNWIDFETEISTVIQVLDEAISVKKSGKELREMMKEKHSILLDIHKASKGSVQRAFKDDTTLIDFAMFLNTELGRLIRALEIYIVEFIGKIPIAEKNVDIKNLNLDHVGDWLLLLYRARFRAYLARGQHPIVPLLWQLL